MRVSDMNIDRIYINSTVRNITTKMPENHYHYYYELYYVSHGGCRFFIDSATPYDLHSGDYLVIPPKQAHFNNYLSQTTRINIYFREQDLINGNEPVSSAFVDRIRSRVLKVHIPRAYRGLFDQIFDQMLAEDKIDDERTAAIMKLQFQQLILYSERLGTTAFADTSVQYSESEDAVLQAAKYLAENYNQQITLTSLAELYGLSPSYFSRKFHQVTGMGMKEYLSGIRLDHAARQLLSTTHSITDIALDCGFSDSNYFKDAFRKTYGMSPRAYRSSRMTDSMHAQTLDR